MSVSIDTGDKGGKKKLDTELNLVPFIDLLITNICFLLMTAVWTQMARINVNQKGQAQAAQSDEEKPPEQIKLVVLIEDDAYTLIAGPERISIPKKGEHYDTDELTKKLQEIKTRLPDTTDITVAAEDVVKYDYIISVMDIALRERFPDIQLSDAGAAI